MKRKKIMKYFGIFTGVTTFIFAVSLFVVRAEGTRTKADSNEVRIDSNEDMDIRQQVLLEGQQQLMIEIKEDGRRDRERYWEMFQATLKER